MSYDDVASQAFLAALRAVNGDEAAADGIGTLVQLLTPGQRKRLAEASLLLHDWIASSGPVTHQVWAMVDEQRRLRRPVTNPLPREQAEWVSALLGLDSVVRETEDDE